MTESIFETGRLINGDCLEVMPTIADKSVDMILSDLPYAFESRRITANDWDLPIDLNSLWAEYKRIIKPTGAIVLTATNPFASYLVMSNLEMYKYEWIWEKDNGSNFVNVKTQPFKVHEQVLVFGFAPTTYNKNDYYMNYNPQFTYSTPYENKRGQVPTENLAFGEGYRMTPTINEDGKRHPRTVQKFNLERGLHPTQKPVELFEYLVRTYTNKDDIVLDSCSGSGTTAIACINSERKYICIEKDEDYYTKSADRIRNHSNKIIPKNNLINKFFKK